MNIGVASQKSGLPAKTIRYYDDIGLLSSERASNGYRVYSAQDLGRLRFLRRSRNLGFSVEECRQLLSLYDDGARQSADVKALASAKLADLEVKLAEMLELRATLGDLVERCKGDAQAQCTILDGLAADS